MIWDKEKVKLEHFFETLSFSNIRYKKLRCPQNEMLGHHSESVFLFSVETPSKDCRVESLPEDRL